MIIRWSRFLARACVFLRDYVMFPLSKRLPYTNIQLFFFIHRQVTECSRTMMIGREQDTKTESVTRQITTKDLRFLQPKLPLDSRRPPDASILHYSCSANDKVASSPAWEIMRDGKSRKLVILRIRRRAIKSEGRAISSDSWAASHDDFTTAFVNCMVKVATWKSEKKKEVFVDGFWFLGHV